VYERQSLGDLGSSFEGITHGLL
jgi:transcriptional regulator with XRE-family HTH domain